MPKTKELSIEMRSTLIGYHKRGKSNRAISELKVSRRTIDYDLKKFKTDESVRNKTCSEGPRTTTSVEDRKIVISSNVDSILNGGLAVGHVYKLCGKGKNTILPYDPQEHRKKSPPTRIYLDCKGDFNAARIKTILDCEKMTNPNVIEIMSKILVKRISTLFELINSLHQIKNEIVNGLNIKLIIVDSLPALLYQFEEFVKCNGILNHLVNVMQFLASEYYTCFVVTNVLTTWYDGNIGEEKLLTEKIGSGKYWQSVPNTRLIFAKSDGDDKCKISVCKSREVILNTDCLVTISDVGME